MTTLRTKEEAVDRLRSGYEQCISCLQELIRVQFELDPHDRAIGPDDEEIVYRLRKVLVHTKAITSWQLDTDVMHVLAPEIRAANEQIDMVWKKLPKEELNEYLSDHGRSVVGGRDQLFKPKKEILSSVIHPTPLRLLFGKDLGGLRSPDEVRYFTILFVLLGGLVFRYAVSLGFMSQLQNGRCEASITSVMRSLRTSGGI